MVKITLEFNTNYNKVFTLKKQKIACSYVMGFDIWTINF